MPPGCFTCSGDLYFCKKLLIDQYSVLAVFAKSLWETQNILVRVFSLLLKVWLRGEFISCFKFLPSYSLKCSYIQACFKRSVFQKGQKKSINSGIGLLYKSLRTAIFIFKAV